MAPACPLALHEDRPAMHTLPATHNELAAWLRLSLATGLKPAALRLLLSAFGLPEAILRRTMERSPRSPARLRHAPRWLPPVQNSMLNSTR
jgi:predicted Rossmann fold nucleotide-binding protein DprA/Smf involved in DNA uptake